jgi:hypothetical protein
VAYLFLVRCHLHRKTPVYPGEYLLDLRTENFPKINHTPDEKILSLPRSVADISEEEPNGSHDKNEADPPRIISYCVMDAVEKGQSGLQNGDNAIKENKCSDDCNDLVSRFVHGETV